MLVAAGGVVFTGWFNSLGTGGLPFRLTGPARKYRSVYDENPRGGWRPTSPPAPAKRGC